MLLLSLLGPMPSALLPMFLDDKRQLELFDFLQNFPPFAYTMTVTKGVIERNGPLDPTADNRKILLEGVAAGHVAPLSGTCQTAVQWLFNREVLTCLLTSVLGSIDDYLLSLGGDCAHAPAKAVIPIYTITMIAKFIVVAWLVNDQAGSQRAFNIGKQIISATLLTTEFVNLSQMGDNVHTGDVLGMAFTPLVSHLFMDLFAVAAGRMGMSLKSSVNHDLAEPLVAEA